MSPDLLTILIRRYSSNVEIPKRLFVLVKHRTQIYSLLIVFRNEFYQFVLSSKKCGTDMDLGKNLRKREISLEGCVPQLQLVKIS